MTCSVGPGRKGTISARQSCEAWHLMLDLLLSHRAHLPVVAAEFELSPAQCHVVKLIEPGQTVSMGDLANALSCDASNVTGLVDRLEDRGIIERRLVAHDRRKKLLALTPGGTRLRGKLLERMGEPPRAFERLSMEEQRALVVLLRRLLP